MNDIQARTFRFVETLRIATYDKLLELHGFNLAHYYDADVVLQMILGFDGYISVRPQSPEFQLVRALLSCQVLGEMRMLPPHAAELAYNLKHSLPNLEDRHSQEAFASRARLFLQKKGIASLMGQMQEIATEAKGKPIQSTEDFLDILRSNTAEVFTAIEAINGTWLQRIRRYHYTGLLKIDNSSTTASISDPIIHEINSIIRENSQALRSISSDFNDSAALGMLARMIEQGEELSHRRPLVRFYTETKTLQRAWGQSERLRQLLSYSEPPDIGHAIPSGGEFVVRNARYFLMRAMFSDLSPFSSSDDVQNLQDVLASLESILSFKEEEIAPALSQLSLEGRTLLEAIQDLEELALMRTVWSKNRLPSEFFNLMPEWTEVFRFAQSGVASDLMFMQIEDVQRDIDARIGQFRTWSGNYQAFLTAAKGMRAKIDFAGDPMRDLGLVRWGYAIGRKDAEELTYIIQSFIDGDEEELTRLCATLAMRLEKATSDLDECSLMCAVLWALGRFSSIVDLVLRCEAAGKEISPSLTVIKSAAELKSGILAGRNERKRVVDWIWKLREKLSETDRASILLGMGYVLYHAWKQELISSMRLKEDLPQEVLDWAEMSFEAGEEAVMLLEPSELAWAFAVNHCAYVGIVTGRDSTKADYYLNILIRMQNFPDVWHGRFDDTLGCYYLWRLEHLTMAPTKQPLSQNSESVRDYEQMVLMAERYFFRAKKHDVGDIDIDEHIMRLDRVKAAILTNLK